LIERGKGCILGGMLDADGRKMDAGRTQWVRR